MIHNKSVIAFSKFVSARERHRIGKVGNRAVDRADPIIAKYRFCNVRRNDDRVTKWVHENYLERWRDDPNLWFALIVARLFNNEDTLDALKKGVLPFKPEYLRTTLHHRANKMGLKNFNAAYIVSTNGKPGNKVDYLIDSVLTPAWNDRKRIGMAVEFFTELERVHEILCGLMGLKSFMAAQIIADLKYADPKRWTDFHTFCASGPGSKRGLNRVLGRPVDHPWREEDFRATVLELREKTNAKLPTWEPITAQDIQNCLCEYDKYCRVPEGLAPKQLY